MDSLFQKINLKDKNKILILNMPQNFKSIIDQALKEGVIIDDERMPSTIYSFALVFITSVDEIGVTASMTVKSLVKERPTFWIAYPKVNSPQYHTDIKNETDWAVMAMIGFKIEESIDIDEDWSAYKFVRFNKVSI